MKYSRAVLASFCAATSIVVDSACSSGMSPAGIAASSSSSASSASTTYNPNVSFAQDIMPVFQNNCATATGGSCHGSTTVTTQLQPRPYLGPFLTALDAGIVDQVYDGIVNVASNEAPGMDYVAPGNPANSFLWHKVDGDLASIASRCTNMVSSTDPCGSQMPDQNTSSGMQPPLDTPTQNMIVDWIDAGAQNN